MIRQRTALGWKTKIPEEQIRAAVEKYVAGGRVGDIIKEAGISRSTLFRYLSANKGMRRGTSDLQEVRSELAQVKAVVALLAAQIHEVLQNQTR